MKGQSGAEPELFSQTGAVCRARALPGPGLLSGPRRLKARVALRLVPLPDQSCCSVPLGQLVVPPGCFAPLDRSWDAFGPLFGRSLGALGSFLGPLGPFLAALGRSWPLLAALGPLLGDLGPLLSDLASLLAALGSLLAALGSSWGVILGSFLAILAAK